MLLICSNAANTDYSPRNVTLTFGAMLSSQCDVINIIDDDEKEQQEMFVLTLTTSDPAVLFDSDVADVLINNNDCKFEHFYMNSTKCKLIESLQFYTCNHVYTCTIICFCCSDHWIYRISIHSA